MSEKFQRIKERNDVRKHLIEFIANSILYAVNRNYFCKSSCFVLISYTRYINRFIELRL
jgi:hypothetical protein